MRNETVNIVFKSVKDEAIEAATSINIADNIISALPSMVKPLELIYGVVDTPFGQYKVEHTTNMAVAIHGIGCGQAKTTRLTCGRMANQKIAKMLQ